MEREHDRLSLPTWGRGLKPIGGELVASNRVSLPTWGRGLKHGTRCPTWTRHSVAPYMGAWIETLMGIAADTLAMVAPYMGAWIET